MTDGLPRNPSENTNNIPPVLAFYLHDATSLKSTDFLKQVS